MSKKLRSNRSKQWLRGRQAGAASILVTMITMVVISLIVLGFATIARREQGNTLDQQLSTQAFYAAESGVEDARNVITSAIANSQSVPGKTDCSTNTDGAGYSPNYPVGAATTLDSAHHVSYSCLLVNPSPTSLVYKGVDSNSVVVPLSASQVIDKIVITWSPSSTASGTPSSCPASTSGSFSPATEWTCGYGLLRMDVVPTDGSPTRAGLQSSTLSSFFEPLNTSASGNLSYSGNTGKGNVVAANCDTASYTQCSATIVGLASSTGFAMRIASLYQTSDVTVTAYHGGTVVGTSGAQAVVDVTGNANGVLRRIQVRMCTNKTYCNGTVPGYGLETNGGLCKRFLVTPGYLSIPSDIVNPDTSNAMCVSQTSGTPASGG